MNTVKKTKLKGKYTAWALVLALVCILTAAIIWVTYRRKGKIQVAGDTYYVGSFPLEGYFDYHRMNEKWAGNPLGETKDTMGSSDCLTCCITVPLKKQGIYDYIPGQLSQLFNNHRVCNESGATIRKDLEGALPSVTVDLDGQMSSAFINRMIEQEKYPIVKARRRGGTVYWIMLMGTEKGPYDITTVDSTDGYVHLSDYANTTYSIHVVAEGFY